MKLNSGETRERGKANANGRLGETYLRRRGAAAAGAKDIENSTVALLFGEEVKGKCNPVNNVL